jgi:hypothetical protein
MKKSAVELVMEPPSTPPDIVELMVLWFFQNFEDPAHNTPWDEGECVFIWGGPFDARAELEDAFGTTVTPRSL